MNLGCLAAAEAKAPVDDRSGVASLREEEDGAAELRATCEKSWREVCAKDMVASLTWAAE